MPVPMEVKGQLLGVSFFPFTTGVQELNSGHQVWLQGFSVAAVLALDPNF